MKAVKNKQTGKLSITRKKEPVIHHWSESDDKRADRQFGQSLRNSGDKLQSLKQVSERQYIDTRPSINKKD